jgi:hypothetical protein
MSRKPAKTISQIEGFEIKEDKRKEEKVFQVRHVPERGLYQVAFTAGGEVPDALKGMWTNAHKAQAAITNYLAAKEQEQLQAAA